MISIIVPAYNAAGTIKHCLNSLLDQDFADYEIIVIDDGSNDSTGDICKKYMQANILHLWIQMIMWENTICQNYIL